MENEMSIRKIYVNMNTLLDIRFIRDELEPLNNTSWRGQFCPDGQRMLLTVNPRYVSYSDPGYNVSLTDFKGNIKAHCNFGEVERLQKENAALKEKLFIEKEELKCKIADNRLFVQHAKDTKEQLEQENATLKAELEAMKAKEDRAAKERDRYLEQLEEWRRE
jgi:hypothetical protein